VPRSLEGGWREPLRGALFPANLGRSPTPVDTTVPHSRTRGSQRTDGPGNPRPHSVPPFHTWFVDDGRCASLRLPPPFHLDSRPAPIRFTSSPPPKPGAVRPVTLDPSLAKHPSRRNTNVTRAEPITTTTITTSTSTGTPEPSSR